MKRIFSVVVLMLLSQGVFAFDMNKAAEAYASLQNELAQAVANGGHTRSVTKVIFEGYLATSSAGMLFASKETLTGPISKTVLHGLGTTLYEEANYGLYSYKGYKVQVWYVGDLASVITMMGYSNN